MSKKQKRKVTPCAHEKLYACQAHTPTGAWSTVIWCANCGKHKHISPWAQNPEWIDNECEVYVDGTVVDILAWPGSDFETLRLLCLTFDERRAISVEYDSLIETHETIKPKTGYEVACKSVRLQCVAREVNNILKRYADARGTTAEIKQGAS